jgi:hypothetical protein
LPALCQQKQGEPWIFLPLHLSFKLSRIRQGSELNTVH